MNPALAINSLLFVPGSRPDRFVKAQASGADLVCIDLEDSVAAIDKDAARTAALELLRAGDPRLALRINGVATRAGLADLLALAEAAIMPPVLLVPMVESPRDLAIVTGVLELADRRLVPLLESAGALRVCHEIATGPNVAGLMFGGGDLAAELGVALAWEPLAAARGQFVLGAAGRGLALIDVPFVGLDDAEGLGVEAKRARALGFTAKAAIHPAQLPAIHAAFKPSDREVDEAKAALQAFEQGGGRAVRHAGRMLERPLVRHYEAVLARRERADA